MQVSATSFAQKVTLGRTNSSLKGIFKELKAQTGYNFLYTERQLLQAKPVSLNVKDADLRDVLQQLFVDQPLSYELDRNTIVVRVKNVHVKTIEKQQEVQVTGSVTDVSGSILPGVSIYVKSKPSQGTSSDLNGNYILKLMPSEVLVFKIVGYETQEIPLAGRTKIDVVMELSSADVEEVVVTAFGQKASRESLVGSITSVSPKELRTGSSNITTALQGRVAGMISFQRSGEPGLDNADFFIRGVGSFGVNNSPLILVDNMEVTTDDLARIPVDDIESFSVLKDAAAAAVYGSRGANGVLLVTELPC
jgi:TonB-dependent SusC/RagA subfamily outer membrane receptor